MAIFWRDLCVALRILRRSPSAALPVILVLTLGIGMATALYAVVYGAWLHPLPYPGANRLVAVFEHFPSYRLDALESTDYGEWQNTRSLGALGAYNFGRAALVGANDTVPIHRASVSGNLPGILRVHAALGRDLLPSDDSPSAARVAMISEGFWRARFGADSRALGTSLNIDGEPYTVVGVLPGGFRLPEEWNPDVLTPLRLDRRFLHHGGGGAKILHGVARLEPGMTIASAEAELRTLLARSRGEEPSLYDAGVSVHVVGLNEYATGGARAAGIVLLGAVASILFLTSLNAASLLIARAAAREREMKIRAALGAGRFRLIRHILLEALPISAAGVAGGLLFAHLLTGLLRTLQPLAVLHTEAARIDGEVLAAALPVVLLCVAAFSLAPVLPLPRVRVRKALTAGELALSLMLLVGALLLFESFGNLRAVSPGFHTSQAVTMSASSAPPDFRRALREKLARLPGTMAVSFADALPPNEFTRTSFFSRRDRPSPTGTRNDTVLIRLVDDQFFQALGIPLLEGRRFTGADLADNSLVAVVNRTLAKRYFATESALGKQVDGPSWKTIVGVVEDIRNDGLRNPPRPEIDLPFTASLKSQGGGVTHANGLNAVIRTASDPAMVMRSLRREVHEADPAVLVNINTMDEQWKELSAGPKFEAEVLAAFAALALILSAAGVYGLMAHLVSLRRKEMAIRLALGARPVTIGMQVIAEAFMPALAGVAAGVAGALALSRLLEGLLFEVKPHDPFTLAIGAAALLALAAGASAFPALSASREDPAHILRAE